MFGDKLRELRKRYGITQDQLAQAIGVERSSIGKYEGRSQVIPSDDIKKRIADYFGVSLDYLMDYRCEDVSAVTLSPDESEIISIWRSLNSSGQVWMLQTARKARENPQFAKESAQVTAI